MATGSTPAKKSTPSSFSDLVGNKNKNKDKTDEVSTREKTPSEIAESSIGPDNDDKNVRVEVTNNNDNDEDFDGDNNPEYDKMDSDPFYAPGVVAMKSDKTPAELAAESPDETAKRYGIDTRITDEDADNPRVQVYRNTRTNQVPSGTHLHPDIARDLQNRGIAEQHTDNAQVTRITTEYYDFAPDADHNDKFVKPAEEKFDRDEDSLKTDGSLKTTREV